MRIKWWSVDLPSLNGWLEVASFERRKDAVKFLIEQIGLPKAATKYFITRIKK